MSGEGCRTGVTGRRRAATVILLAGLGLGCQGGEEAPRDPMAAGAPTSEFRGVELVQQEADGAAWRLTAAEGEGWEAGGTGELRGVTGEIRRAGRTLRLEAGRARVEERDVIRLSGGVEVAWGEYRAQVERAEYQRREGRVVSDAPVVLEGPTLEVRGRGLEVDVEGRSARVREDVRAWVRGGTP